MGLDITAYRKLAKTDAALLDSGGYPVDYMKFWSAREVASTEKEFPGTTAGVEAEAIYSFEERMDFRAGSYGGYNDWRDRLARVAGHESAKAAWDNPPPDGSPFIELISFFDSEGIIGPVVAAKLAKDFADHRSTAESVGSYFFDRYCLWQKAFEMAADGGAVNFH
jgi:hypothetical protein